MNLLNFFSRNLNLISHVLSKNFIFLILLVFPFKALSHTDHYKNINKIEMEILKDGKVIGGTSIIRIKGEVKAPKTNATPMKPSQGPVNNPTE